MIAPSPTRSRSGDRLSTDQQAVCAFVRQALQPYADQVAILHWATGLPEAECQRMVWAELRTILRRARVTPAPIDRDTAAEQGWLNGRSAADEIMVDVARREPGPEWRSFTVGVWQAASDAIGQRHAESAALARAAARAALHAGGGAYAAAKAATECARSCSLRPPPWIVSDAISRAARDHHFALLPANRSARHGRSA